MFIIKRTRMKINHAFPMIGTAIGYLIIMHAIDIRDFLKELRCLNWRIIDLLNKVSGDIGITRVKTFSDCLNC